MEINKGNGYVHKTTNGIYLCVPFSKLGGGRAEMESLAANYRERIEAQKVVIRVGE